MITIKVQDPMPRMRRRINQNPRLSLLAYQELKGEDIFGFGVTVEMLHYRLLSYALGWQPRPRQ